MRLYMLFQKCLRIPYIQVENSVNYATERAGSTLYIYFESSRGGEDWKNNLSFPAKAYRRMGQTVWFAHRGFLKAWRTVEPYLSKEILNPSVKKIVITGYSHGAALAVLCHEYVWYHRPELRQRLEGYGFGCPRVLWGIRSDEVLTRWERFCVIRNMDDLVTHVPPAIFGFFHVGEVLEIGKRGTYSRIDAHRPENILTELRRYEPSQLGLQSEKTPPAYAL